ncbi:MAG: SGNH/GDSL hydrolase family protein [Phycisphaeraceae bacterium]
MFLRVLACTLLLGGFAWITPHSLAEQDVLYQTSFETDPGENGWRMVGSPKRGFVGQWTAEMASDKQHAIRIETGKWVGPKLDVEPHAYYLIRFQGNTAERASWAAQFFDSDGEMVTSDAYDAVLPSEEAGEWREQTTVIRAHPEAAKMHLLFHGVEGGVAIDDLSVERIGKDDARIWIDNLAAENPILHYQPPSDRWEHLPKTKSRLENGEKLRIVMLGDSICNDTSNSLYELLLERDYPGADIEVVTSVRGSTGCVYYQQENRVEQYVLRHDPDLLIIAGISHGNDADAMASVIDQVREKSDAEVLVLNGFVTPNDVIRERLYGFVYFMEIRKEDPADIRRKISETHRRASAFRTELPAMCREKEVAFLDARQAWDHYMVRSGRVHTYDEVMRDSVHANRFGKQIAGRLLYRFLAPDR